MARVAGYAVPMAETDWPVLLQVHIVVKREFGVKARMCWVDTRPPNAADDRLRVTYASDSRNGSPEALLEVLETMTRQLRRQLDVLNSNKIK